MYAHSDGCSLPDGAPLSWRKSFVFFGPLRLGGDWAGVEQAAHRRWPMISVAIDHAV